MTLLLAEFSGRPAVGELRLLLLQRSAREPLRRRRAARAEQIRGEERRVALRDAGDQVV